MVSDVIHVKVWIFISVHTEAVDNVIPGQELVLEQVSMVQQNIIHLLRQDLPVPAQILSLTDSNNQPMHLELDNGLICCYILLQEAINCGCNINPNSSYSQLGHGVTMIKSCRDICRC